MSSSSAAMITGQQRWLQQQCRAAADCPSRRSGKHSGGNNARNGSGMHWDLGGDGFAPYARVLPVDYAAVVAAARGSDCGGSGLAPWKVYVTDSSSGLCLWYPCFCSPCSAPHCEQHSCNTALTLRQHSGSSSELGAMLNSMEGPQLLRLPVSVSIMPWPR